MIIIIILFFSNSKHIIQEMTYQIYHSSSLQLARSLQVLIHAPELLHSFKVSYWFRFPIVAARLHKHPECVLRLERQDLTIVCRFCDFAWSKIILVKYYWWKTYSATTASSSISRAGSIFKFIKLKKLNYNLLIFKLSIRIKETHVNLIWFISI